MEYMWAIGALVIVALAACILAYKPRTLKKQIIVDVVLILLGVLGLLLSHFDKNTSLFFLLFAGWTLIGLAVRWCSPKVSILLEKVLSKLSGIPFTPHEKAADDLDESTNHFWFGFYIIKLGLYGIFLMSALPNIGG